MATVDSERFFRLLVFLNGCGCKVLRKTLLRQLEIDTPGKDFDWHIQSHQGKVLPLPQGHKQMLCAPCNINVLDMTLLCRLLMNICDRRNAPKKVWDAIENLRKIRNTMCHSPNPELSEGDFSRHWNDVEGYLNTLAGETKDGDFIAETYEFIRTISGCPLDISSVSRCWKDLIQTYKDKTQFDQERIMLDQEIILKCLEQILERIPMTMASKPSVPTADNVIIPPDGVTSCGFRVHLDKRNDKVDNYQIVISKTNDIGTIVGNLTTTNLPADMKYDYLEPSTSYTVTVTSVLHSPLGVLHSDCSYTFVQHTKPSVPTADNVIIPPDGVTSCGFRVHLDKRNDKVDNYQIVIRKTNDIGTIVGNLTTTNLPADMKYDYLEPSTSYTVTVTSVLHSPLGVLHSDCSYTFVQHTKSKRTMSFVKMYIAVIAVVALSTAVVWFCHLTTYSRESDCLDEKYTFPWEHGPEFEWYVRQHLPIFGREWLFLDLELPLKKKVKSKVFRF